MVGRTSEAERVAKKKEHKVEIIQNGVRWVAVELEGKVSFTKDGNPVGRARWSDNGEFLQNTAILPDAVDLELSRKIKALIDADYFD
jgi:hypothetical protein